MTTRPYRYAVALFGVTILLMMARALPARSCDIDGVPSLTVNHVVVLFNTEGPTSPATLKVWAAFVAPFGLTVQRTYTFAEIRQRLPLTPEAFKSPWRWAFGDGSPAVRAESIQHAYRHPGVYKVTVSAYFASHRLWYTFDALQVHVVQA